MKLPRWIQLALGAALVAAAMAGCSRSAQSYLDRGNAQLEKWNVDAAVLEYRNAVAKDPMFAQARLKLAEAYLRQGTPLARSANPCARPTSSRTTRTPS